MCVTYLSLVLRQNGACSAGFLFRPNGPRPLHVCSGGATVRPFNQPQLKPVRVAVADANLMACGLVAAGLKRHSHFEVVGCVASVDELLRLINDTAPEVALISSTLRDGILSGLSALPEIHSKYPEMRLVLLIDRSEPEVVVQAFRGGARGVFARSESHFERLCKCVLCVHQGQIWAKTQQLEFIIDALAQASPVRVVDANGANLLTKREEDLVRLVADGLGNRDIAQRLNLSENTVKNYMFHIFNKLGISNRVELVLYAQSQSKCARMSVADDKPPTTMDLAKG